MGKGSRLRKQKMSKESELTNTGKRGLDIIKANTISQSIVGISNAYYTPDGKLMINVSRECRRAELNKLSTELAKVGIKAEYSYPNIQRGDLIIAAESATEDYLDDISASVPTLQIDTDVDKLVEFKKKYDYSLKFDDYSLIMNLPHNDIIITIAGPHKYKGRIIINKTEVSYAVKEINRGNKVWGTNIVGYAILYDNDTNPDEWVIGVPIYLYKSYKSKKGMSYQLSIHNIADGIFSLSNKYEIRKKFRYKIIEGMSIGYSLQLLTGTTIVWNALVRAISDPEMKDQWRVEKFTNENGSILTKYTQIDLEKSPYITIPQYGMWMMDSDKRKQLIEKIDNSHTQSEIVITSNQLHEISEKCDHDLFENEVDTYMKSPYDDFIVTIDDKCIYRVILDKEKIKSVTNSYMYNHKYSEPVGIVMSKSFEYPEYMIFGALAFELFLDRLDSFKLTLTPEIGLSIYEHEESKIYEFQNMIKTTGSDGTNDTTVFLTFITFLSNIIKALNNPEVKEVWETKDVKISDNPDLKKCFPKRPLENIKRIYMCEHTPIDREIERHTDKWFVKGHEVHMKNGTTYFRRGYYKGPARLDEERIVEPRKRTLNTVCNDVKKDLDDFYNLLK